MRNAWKLFALFQQGGGTGGAGSGGAGDGGAGAGTLTAEQIKEMEEKHGKEKQRLSDEAARNRVRANDLEKERDAVRKELEDYRAKHPDATGGDGEGKLPKEVELRIKGLEDKLAQKDREAAEKEKLSLQEKRNAERDASIAGRMAAASVIPEAQEMVRSLIERNTRIEEDGSKIYKGKNLKGEAIEVPLDDLDLHEICHASVFPAKGASGSGGRPPREAGGKGDDVLKGVSQAEYDKMTPAERKAYQRRRVEAHGLTPR